MNRILLILLMGMLTWQEGYSQSTTPSPPLKLWEWEKVNNYLRERAEYADLYIYQKDVNDSLRNIISMQEEINSSLEEENTELSDLVTLSKDGEESAYEQLSDCHAENKEKDKIIKQKDKEIDKQRNWKRVFKAVAAVETAALIILITSLK